MLAQSAVPSLETTISSDCCSVRWWPVVRRYKVPSGEAESHDREGHSLLIMQFFMDALRGGAPAPASEDAPAPAPVDVSEAPAPAEVVVSEAPAPAEVVVGSVRSGIFGDANALPNPPPPKDDDGFDHHGIKRYATHGIPLYVPLSESSKTDLIRAVEACDPARLADLLDEPTHKAKIDAQDLFGFSALHRACQTMTSGVKLGQKSPEGIACAQMLIEHGANVNLHTTDEQWSQTPLHLAVSSLAPQDEICRMLVDANVDLCAVDTYGGTPLHNAAMGTHVAQLRVLVTHPNFDAAKLVVNKEGKTALELAEGVVAKQAKKVERGPNHDECRMLLATGKGFEQLDTDNKLGQAAATARGKTALPPASTVVPPSAA